MIGGAGNDTYYVENKHDVVIEYANQGNDIVHANIAYTLGNNLENLTLDGSGNISGTGNALNNVIIGNSGNNTLTGGAGSDILMGGLGHDKMTGGTGNDVFVFNGLAEMGTTQATRDLITDFEHNVDKIDLSSLSHTLPDGWDFLGGANFSHRAGELHQEASGSLTVIEGDMNGDGIADFQIAFTGHLTFAGNDFLF